MSGLAAHSAEDMFAMSQKITLTWATFLAYILPPVGFFYLMGVLVQLKGTRVYRSALLPVVTWFAWRGAFVDMSGGDPKQAQMNTMLITHMCSIFMHGIIWAVAREPFYRQSPSKEPRKANLGSIYTAFWNAWDLMLNSRGVGWNWSRGVILPKPFLETESRTVFVLLSWVQLVFHAFGFDACLQIMRALSPGTFGSPEGGSLFDGGLPPFLELSRAIFVSFLAVWLAYFAMQWSYHLLAILFTILFQQHPSQWPPLFDSPWLSTSLSELWGRRWHQMMRQLVVTLGFEPFNYLFGRLGGLLGAFLISGVFHDIEMRALGRGGASVTIIGFWVMNGVGVILERVWKKSTGKSVGGFGGWMWSFGWLALWGIPMVDAWAKIGRFGTLSLPGDLEPSLAVARWIGVLATRN